ncbi:MAG: hypothetical protein ABIJ65_02235 [Chloroflexota bacterium]
MFLALIIFNKKRILFDPGFQQVDDGITNSQVLMEVAPLIAMRSVMRACMVACWISAEIYPPE